MCIHSSWRGSKAYSRVPNKPPLITISEILPNICPKFDLKIELSPSILKLCIRYFTRSIVLSMRSFQNPLCPQKKLASKDFWRPPPPRLFRPPPRLLGTSEYQILRYSVSINSDEYLPKSQEKKDKNTISAVAEQRFSGPLGRPCIWGPLKFNK